MKYKQTYFFLLLVMVLANWSCSDNFLEIVPDNALTQDEFISNAADLNEVLAGSYDALSYGGLMGGNTWLLCELMADNISEISARANGDWNAHYTRTTDIFLGTTRGVMHDGGKAIARANYVLDNLSNFSDQLSQDEVNTITGECKFIRAIVNFELVRMFAQPFGSTAGNTHLGIPIRLSYGKEIIGRSTVGEVYAQIISDLNEAASLLPSENKAPVDGSITQNASYATSWSAKGYLAKVYFQMNDFPNAFAQANEVIKNGPFSFDPDLTNRFSPQGTSESVFSLISTSLANDNSAGTLRDHYRFDKGSKVAFSQDFILAKSADPADMRDTLWYLENAGLVHSKKFADDYMQVSLVHLTELKLIRAEAIAEGGGGEKNTAISDLNDIKLRAGVVKLISSIPNATIIEETRKERRLEMIGEGTRFHELKRQAVLNQPDLKIRNADWDCPGMVCQFPDSELAGNLDMVANPFGGCQ